MTWCDPLVMIFATRSFFGASMFLDPESSNWMGLYLTGEFRGHVREVSPSPDFHSFVIVN